MGQVERGEGWEVEKGTFHLRHLGGLPHDVDLGAPADERRVLPLLHHGRLPQRQFVVPDRHLQLPPPSSFHLI